MRKKLINSLITLIMTAALFLSGAVPPCVTANAEPSTLQPERSLKIEPNRKDYPRITATSAIMIDGGSGTVLYEKNADERRDPASITKILNAMVVLDNMELSDTYEIPSGLETVGHVVALKEGEVLSIEQLLYAMLLYSGNDAAEALAYATAGDMKTFCSMMNEKAAQCGATHTNFTNANGLNNPGQENHRTTARDLSLISKEAMKNKTFRKIVSTKTYTIPESAKAKERKIRSTNALLYEKPFKMDDKTFDFYYEGANGIKTGMTSVAGECFIGSAKRGNTELIAVVLNADSVEDKFKDASKLLDYGFENFKTCTLVKSGQVLYELKVKRGSLAAVDLGLAEDMDVTIKKGEQAEQNLNYEVVLTGAKEDFVTAPVAKGSVMGQVVAYDSEGNRLAASELIALEKVEEGGVLSRIGIADEYLPMVLVIFSMLIIGALIVIISIRLRCYGRRDRK